MVGSDHTTRRYCLVSVVQIVDEEYDDIRAIFCIEDIPYIGDFILRVGTPDLYLYRSIVAPFDGF